MKPILTFIALGATLLVIILGRHHLQELCRVARTYASFHPYLKQHSDTLFRYHLRDTFPSGDFEQRVPRIIHRILLSNGNDSWTSFEQASENTCTVLHPEWNFYTWTDADASSFMRQHYPHIWPHYRRYKQTIQRANILRYAVLHHYGGIYLDWDIECFRSLDDLLLLPWLTPGAHPAGVNNAFIVSQPHHPFLTYLLAGVEDSDLSWGLPYIENMLSTGCMYFSNMWMEYVYTMTASPESADDRLYVLADEDGRLEPHMLRGVVDTPLFRHAGASSWHSWDAAIILRIGEYYHACVLLAVAGSIVALLIAGQRCRRLLTGWAIARLGSSVTQRKVSSGLVV